MSSLRRNTSFLGCIALLVASGPIASAAEVPSGSFCERLAPKLKMKTTAVSAQGLPQAGREWRVSLMSLGLALFGGSISATFGVRPIGEWTPADISRLHDVCKQTKKGVNCSIEGPMRLTVGVKSGNVDNDAMVGERATVGLRKTEIYCKDS